MIVSDDELKFVKGLLEVVEGDYYSNVDEAEAILKYINSKTEQEKEDIIKPDVIKSVCKCGNELTEKEIFYETCLKCDDSLIG